MPSTWTYWSTQQAVLPINGINRMGCPEACHIWQMFWGQSDSLSALCMAPHICLWKLKAQFIPLLNPKISSHTWHAQNTVREILGNNPWEESWKQKTSQQSACPIQIPPSPGEVEARTRRKDKEVSYSVMTTETMTFSDWICMTVDVVKRKIYPALRNVLCIAGEREVAIINTEGFFFFLEKFWTAFQRNSYRYINIFTFRFNWPGSAWGNRCESQDKHHLDQCGRKVEPCSQRQILDETTCAQKYL